MNRIRQGDIRNSEDLQKLINACEVVKRKGKENWTAADIISAIHAGNVFFSLGDGDDVIVWYIKNEEFTGNRILWLWIAYIKDMDSYMEEFREYFSKLGIKSMFFDSKRPGWIRKVKKLSGNMTRITFKVDF